jgi:twitching motility two-component system response regulator PilG
MNALSETNLNGIKVVCIDDSKSIRRTLDITLTGVGCEVFTAYNGYEALSKIFEHQPDIIIVDDLMPCINGYQTCTLIRSNPTFNKVPIIMLGSCSNLIGNIHCKILGIAYRGFYPKSREEILKIVKTCVVGAGIVSPK